tara:strand:- start:449 stop:574 length:126 start_codon:yes stop_codon:yes gene_type:complete
MLVVVEVVVDYQVQHQETQEDLVVVEAVQAQEIQAVEFLKL